VSLRDFFNQKGDVMKMATFINDTSIRFYVYSKHILPFLILGVVISILMTNKGFAAGTNYLSGLKADVGATFGSGSDTEYFILLGEGLLSAIGYMKTKNIMLLGGLPVLMAFTHWALK
jgi:hypothetical protein